MIASCFRVHFLLFIAQSFDRSWTLALYNMPLIAAHAEAHVNDHSEDSCSPVAEKQLKSGLNAMVERAEVLVPPVPSVPSVPGVRMVF